MSDITVWSATASGTGNQATPPNGFPEGMSPASLNDSARELMAAVRRSWERNNPTATTSGSGNAYSLSYAVAPAAYVEGETYSFIPNFTNSGPATLNINLLGDIAIKAGDGASALGAGAITSGYPTSVMYNGSVFQLVNGVSLTGDATGAGVGTIALTLANSGVTANIYGNLTIDAKGRITAARGMTATDIAGLGSAALVNTGSTGTAIPLLSAVNTWGAQQIFPEVDIINVAGPTLNLAGNVATTRIITFSSLISGASSNRWAMAASAIAESGTNVGSDFGIARFNNSGVGIDFPLVISRSTGTSTLTNLAVSGSAAVTAAVTAATMTATGAITAGSFVFASKTIGTNAIGNRTASVSAPSGGADGDLWFQYT